MIDDEIKNLIQKEISDAKLDVSEKRFRTLVIIAGSFLTIFGVLFPIFITSSSSNKVDDAVNEMKQDVKYLNETAEKRIGNIESNLEDEIKDLKTDVKELILEQKSSLNYADEKLDEKINEYENKFNTLTKDALRKPLIVCTIDDKPIEGEIFRLDRFHNQFTLKLENNGDATAKNIQLYLFLKSEIAIYVNGEFESYYNLSEIPNYEKFIHN